MSSPSCDSGDSRVLHGAAVGHGLGTEGVLDRLEAEAALWRAIEDVTSYYRYVAGRPGPRLTSRSCALEDIPHVVSALERAGWRIVRDAA